MELLGNKGANNKTEPSRGVTHNKFQKKKVLGGKNGIGEERVLA